VTFSSLGFSKFASIETDLCIPLISRLDEIVYAEWLEVYSAVNVFERDSAFSIAIVQEIFMTQ
jgi:hypothetical protein